MRAFKTDYTEDLVGLTTELEKMIGEEADFTKKELEVADEKISELDEALQTEIADRKKDTTALLEPMKAQVGRLQSGVKSEVQATLDMEKRTLEGVAANIEEQRQVILNEKKERSERLQDIFDMLEQDITLQNKFFDTFEEKAKASFGDMVKNLEGEMDNRLDH